LLTWLPLSSPDSWTDRGPAPIFRRIRMWRNPLSLLVLLIVAFASGCTALSDTASPRAEPSGVSLTVLPEATFFYGDRLSLSKDPDGRLWLRNGHPLAASDGLPSAETSRILIGPAGEPLVTRGNGSCVGTSCEAAFRSERE
jgi:hypothetical protein